MLDNSILFSENSEIIENLLKILIFNKCSKVEPSLVGRLELRY